MTEAYGDPHGGLRIGDTERDTAATALGEHFAAGRLDSDEYDERVGRVWSARVRHDLRGLFDDLPGGPPPGLAAPPVPTYPGPAYPGPAPAPPPAQGADHWVASPSAWRAPTRSGVRSVRRATSAMPTWLVVVAAIVLLPVALAFVASALPFLLAGAAAWFFLVGPGRSAHCGPRRIRH